MEPHHIQVSVVLDGHGGPELVATGEVDRRGRMSLTGDTDLAELSAATGGYFSADDIEQRLIDAGCDAWRAEGEV